MGIVQQDRPNFPQRWQTAQNWKLKTENALNELRYF